MIDYGHLVKEYAEDNEISWNEAYKKLHCDCEDEINVTESKDDQGKEVLEFDTIMDYILWAKKHKIK